MINFEYPFDSQPRYGYGKPPHQKLYEIINRSRGQYIKHLHDFLKYQDFFLKIHSKLPDDDPDPRWINDWIPGLDAVALCGFLCQNNPQKYIEIGSGNSTKFARKAIREFNLRTKIISIDPCPRSEIDTLCDVVVRKALQDLDLDFFRELKSGDILFVDSSHQVFMNSTASVIFLDIIPELETGVLVEFHDIFLPFDYPPVWTQRCYSEQYLLAAYLLAEGHNLDIMLANHFINTDDELNKVLDPLWHELKDAGSNGASFWARIT